MSRRPAERRTQHAVMATASDWVRIREPAADAGKDLSRYVVHRASAPDPLPDSVLRRTVRELPLLARIEQQRMADMGLEERWNALGDAVDAWEDALSRPSARSPLVYALRSKGSVSRPTRWAALGAIAPACDH